MSKGKKTDSYAPNAENSSTPSKEITLEELHTKLAPKRFEVRRTLLGSITVEMSTNDLEGAAELFLMFKNAMDEGVDQHPAEPFMDDVQHFCVWDTHGNTVAFFNGMFLTTYILGEIEDVEDE